MTEMMKAYVIHQPQQIAFVDDYPIPELEDECILLKSQRVSICSTDVGYYKGDFSPPQWPIIPCHEYVGEVVESRLSNSKLKVGDKVVYWGQTDFGGLAEYRAIKPLFPGTRQENHWFTERYFVDDKCAAAVILDNDIPLEEASLIEPIAAVLRSLLCYPPMPGDDVIVLGAGPCGLIALQLLKNWYGVHSVTVLDKNPYRLKVASNLGADEIYNVETEQAQLKLLIEDSQARYAEYVFDALPDINDSKDIPNTRTVAMRLLNPGGTYIVFGAMEAEQQIDMWSILSKGLKLRASAFDVRQFPMWKTADILKVAKNVISHRMISLPPIISHVVDFYSPDCVKRAFTEYGMTGRLKITISFDSAGEGSGQQVVIFTISLLILCGLCLLASHYLRKKPSISYPGESPKETNCVETLERKKFFISYPGERREKADRVETLLRRKNCTVYRDNTNFRPGAQITNEIMRYKKELEKP